MTLKVEKIVKKLGNKTIVEEVSFYLNPGEIVGILGPNGAGKSSSFYITLGLTHSNGGKVFLDDLELTNLPTFKRARLGLGYLPQDSSIFQKLTVEENILVALENHCKEKKEKKLELLLEDFSLQRVRKSQGAFLSGGERRRTEIARALAMEPKYLLLDEPFAGIDPLAISDIKEIILRLKKQGLGLLITDHNVKDLLSIVDRSYIIYEGKVFAEGTVAELLAREDIKKIYLGTDFSL